MARCHPAATPERGLRAVLLLVLALALSWQSFATQTHRHPVPNFSTASSAASQDIGVRGPQPLGPSDCPICQEIALSGAYVTPTPAVLPLPVEPARWYPRVPAPHALASQPRWHGWQSRAPPLPI